MEIWREYTFEAAHHLPHVPEGHKCGLVHGHSYRITVTIDGPVNEQAGWVMDFADISKTCKPLAQRLDHTCLNHIPGLENPTSENLARWWWDQIAGTLPLAAVTVQETSSTGCTYRGPSAERKGN